MQNSEALKDCLRQLMEVSPEDTIPLEIMQQGITLQQELLKLIKKKTSPEKIEAVRLQLGLFQDLVNVQKATRAAIQQFLGVNAGDGAPVNYHGMGIKKIMENKQKKNGNNV